MKKDKLTTVQYSIDRHKMAHINNFLKDKILKLSTTAAKDSHRTSTKRHILQKFRFICLITSIDEFSNEFCDGITQLKHNAYTVDVLIHIDQYVDFLTEIIDDEVLMIVSDALGYLIVSLTHDILSLNTILVFSCDRVHGE